MKKAFTLIELLVVIAIIAILAAILFPVFTQAKAAAKTTAALSNAKQNGLAVLMYIGDADDTYPQSAYFVVTPTSRQIFSAYDAIYPYGKNKDIYDDPAETNAIPWKSILETKIPGGPYASPVGIVKAGLGLNFALFEDPGIPFPISPSERDVVRSEGGIPLTAETTMFFSADYTDAGRTNKWASKYPNFGTGATAYLAGYKTPTTPFDRTNFAGAPRHNGKIVVNYADGHAKSINGNAKLAGTGINQNTTSTALVDCYNLPFDLNGIPDVVGEPSLVPQQ
jgi:prepilin-type N-terminal cleavage/methylation domain-containing protein/prepilin-type processing-associated H-X9-DG protein